MYRQGDVLLIKVKSIPKKAKEKENNIIMEGEATGHAHCIEAGIVLLNDNDIFVKVEQKARLFHDEHGEIDLQEGNYKVVRQREYIDNVQKETPENIRVAKSDKGLTFYRYVQD